MYRANVCIVITNEKKDKVLMFHRLGVEKKGWQFPQGGVDEGESYDDAFLRELKEEIGTNEIKLLRRLKKMVRYKFPQGLTKTFKNDNGQKRRYKGQKQRWYLVQLLGGTESIHFDHQPQEFDQYKWVSPAKAWKKIIKFKQKAYKKGLRKLKLLG